MVSKELVQTPHDYQRNTLLAEIPLREWERTNPVAAKVLDVIRIEQGLARHPDKASEKRQAAERRKELGLPDTLVGFVMTPPAELGAQLDDYALGHELSPAHRLLVETANQGFVLSANFDNRAQRMPQL